MLVKKWMSKNVITIRGDQSMQRAINLMREHHIRILPVVTDDKLVGIVTDGDIKKASVADEESMDVPDVQYLAYKTRISDIMTRDLITVPPDNTVEEAAAVLLSNKISGAPVVDADGRMVGIITRDDIFRVLIALTAMGTQGVQFAFHAPDRPGILRELAEIIRGHGGRAASILTSRENAPEGFRNVYIRTFNLNSATIPQLIEELSEKATLLYVVDHESGKREIFE
jgi:acetoin utilization protein AcuB